MLGNRLILMQGPAGGGKSTVAKAVHEILEREHSVVCYSTDDERYTEDGVYVFDSKTDFLNHEKTLKKCELAMVRDVEVIIIDNTCILKKYAQPYLDLAHTYGYDTQVIRVTAELGTILKQNDRRTPDRRVPKEVIDKMTGQMEDLV